MYKTTAEARETRTEQITVDMDSDKEVIEVYTRNNIDSKIVSEAIVHLSPGTFRGLVCPILKAMGYTVIETPEGM